MHKKVLVVGGGIAGIQSALDLAEMGIEVFLVEREPSIGGRMAQLDKTFPTNDCAMCILSPKLVEAGSHPYIHILTHSEIVSLDGEAPRFVATVLKRPRYVDEGKCTGCGICMSKCPVRIPDPYNKGLSTTKCIRIPFPQAVPAIPILDKEHCIYLQRGRCRICERFCEVKAIDYEQKEETLTLEVGSVILAIGSNEFDAVLKDEYGYKTFPNVMTSIEFERILSASGPTQGHILRPSDDKEPESIAFIQCLGSRDRQMGNEYCSAVCCMQAVKDSIIVREHLPKVQTTIFYMDMRAYGKDFDKFVDQAKNQYGTQFLHARIASVEVNPQNEDLIIQYNTDEGNIQREEFGLVVLSLGLLSTGGIKQVANRLSIELDECGFARTPPFSPVATSRPGVFVAGTFSGPKDIPETVMQASGAVSAASALLIDFPSKEIKEELPPEADLRGQGPRVGVFVCRCGINIAAIVDVPEVVNYAATLPRVVHAQELLFACSQDSQKLISEWIKEKELNRVVVSACTPRTHEPLFQKTLRTTGLNPYLFEFANIREQCSWVHQKEPEKATAKVKDLIRMAVAKATQLESLSKLSVSITKGALVIGGGLAGMTATKDLSAQGFEVHLVEKEPELGGNLRHLHYTLDGERVDDFLRSLVNEVEADPKIHVHTGTSVEEVSGYIGNFRTTLSHHLPAEKEAKTPIEHGAIIVATGGREYVPTEFLYGQDDRVITQRQLENLLSDDDHQAQVQKWKSVVMIQCVGSRNEEHPYCSRVCCSTAIKNALKLKESNPDIRIYILYRDIRTYGTKEIYYRQAREKGILFVRYDQGTDPVATKRNGTLKVRTRDTILARDLEISPDLLVLSPSMVPNDQNKVLSQMLKVPLNADGFFLEAHVKLRPVDFATDGIFVCGLAHYPKDISETITQAKAAAARAVAILRKDQIETEGKVSQVKKERCIGCGLCVEVCAYKAIELDPKERVAVVNEALCKGCGACAGSCRPGAIDLKGFRNDQILAALAAA